MGQQDLLGCKLGSLACTPAHVTCQADSPVSGSFNKQ